MLTKLIMYLSNRFPHFRRLFFQWAFDCLALLTRDLTSWTLMNYGYAPTNGEEVDLTLEGAEEAERYCFQLYYAVTAPIGIEGKSVCEVSCGRGGGAHFLSRHLKAKSLFAVDLSANQIKFCRKRYKEEGLRFIQGDAEELTLPDACFDVVVNIEASCLYPNRQRFFNEVFRVLRPGGSFAYADLFFEEELGRARRELSTSGLSLVKERDITANVRLSLKEDSARREQGLGENAPWVLRGLLKQFAGTKGTRIPTLLEQGQLTYASFVLIKPTTEKNEFYDATDHVREKLLESA